MPWQWRSKRHGRKPSTPDQKKKSAAVSAAYLQAFHRSARGSSACAREISRDIAYCTTAVPVSRTCTGCTGVRAGRRGIRIAAKANTGKARQDRSMSSILQRTSRSQNRNKADGGNLSSLQQAAPAACPLLVAVSSTSTIVDDAPSRGVPLLTRGKQFHLTQRGLKETSGFWYISKQPKRQARLQ